MKSDWCSVCLSLLAALLCSFVFPAKSCILPLVYGSGNIKPHESALHAQVVLVGRVKDKLEPTERRTYSIHFEIKRIIKGRQVVENLPAHLPTSQSVSLLRKDEATEALSMGPEGQTYTISNFGDTLDCKANVEVNRWYILYLRVANGHLSAKYDSPYGAAREYTQQLEQSLLSKLYGWKAWTGWSSCSVSCGTGRQLRKRSCSGSGLQGNCVGSSTEWRACNLFSCTSEGIKDLTKLAGFESLPLGVIVQKSETTGKVKYYDITPNFYGQISAAKIFQTPKWPSEYSVLARVRPRKTNHPRAAQYLLSLADSSGKQYFGIRLYGNTQNKNPMVELLFEDGEQHAARLLFGHSSIGIQDGRWHQMAFHVSGNRVEAYSDCQKIGSVQFPASLGSPMQPKLKGTSLLVGSQMFKMYRKAKERFEGAISQLVLSEGGAIVQQQCSQQVHGEASLTAKNGTMVALKSQTPCANADDEDCGEFEGSGMPTEHWEWTEWSACSASCGEGRRVRKAYCKDKSLKEEDCIPYYVQPRIQPSPCNNFECPTCGCKNGGECQMDQTCTCPPGWTGNKCQKAICQQHCQHGKCIRPDQCSCVRGWTGQDCSTPICKLECENGGICVSPNSCRCPSGYGGQYCSLRLTYCIFQCENGGKCVGYNKCECPDGYSGKYCRHKEPVCEQPCLNGGTCAGGQKCDCPKGYSGEQCQIDSCGQCQNGGRCNSYTKACECPRLVTGPLCEFRILSQQSCKKHPCKNGGQCIGHNKCHCPEGWFGRNCKLKRCKTYAYKYTPTSYQVRKPVYRFFPCSVKTSASNPHSIVCRKFIGYKTETKEYQKKVLDYSNCAEQ